MAREKFVTDEKLFLGSLRASRAIKNHVRYLTPLQRNICHFEIYKGGSVEETVLAEILPEIVE